MVTSEQYNSPEFVRIVTEWFNKSNFVRSDVELKSEKFVVKRRKLIQKLKFAKTYKWNNHSIDLILKTLVQTCG